MSLVNQFFKNTKFRNKTIIVTGCNGQFGIAICKMFLNLRCYVFGIDISTSKFKNIKFTFIKCDIS